MLYYAITEGIVVKVEASYYPDASTPIRNEYVFVYKIQIENHSTETIQLLRRHWIITDSYVKREVEGAGVVGKQPILEPGENYEYVSGCHLISGIGKMNGTYLMQKRDETRKMIKVKIPTFYMVAPVLLN